MTEKKIEKKYIPNNETRQKLGNWSYIEWNKDNNNTKITIQYSFKLGQEYINQSIWINKLFFKQAREDLINLLKQIGINES